MKEWITLSRCEVQRSQVLQQVALSGLTLKAGAGLMKLSYQETKLLWGRYLREGPQGLAHRGRGRQPGNALRFE